MSQQSFDLIDGESGFKLTLKSERDILDKDVIIIIPDGDNATLATTKQLEDMRTNLTNGAITVRSSETVGGKQADEFALKDLSNVNLSGLNLGNGGSASLMFARFRGLHNTVPTVGNFLDVFATGDPTNTLPIDRKIDNNKYLLKAGNTYSIKGGIISYDMTGGNLQIMYSVYSVTSGQDLTPSGLTSLTCYKSFTGSSLRNYDCDAYIKPTEDVYLRAKVLTNSLTSGSNLIISTSIEEISSTELKITDVVINGKSFDNNNNIDLEGLSTLSNYSLSEILTERRWVDGKPIYRKILTYSIGATPPSTDITISSGIVNGDTVWVEGFKIIDNSFTSSESNSYYLSNTIENRIINSKDGSLVYIKISDANSGLVNSVYYITMEYTKTTDTSNSPVRLVGSGNGTAGVVSELPALTGSTGKLLRVDENGLLEWFDNSFIGCSVVSNSSTSLVAATPGKIKFTTEVNCKIYDTNSSFDYANGKFIAPVTGYYDVLGKVAFGTTGYNRTQINKNGTAFRIGGDSNGTHSFVNDVVFLNAGDTIELYGYSAVTNTTIANSSTYLTITLKK